jgi:hypothetical protein
VATATAALARNQATALGVAGPYQSWVMAETGDLDAARQAFEFWMEHVFPQVPGVLRYLGAAVAVPIAARLGDAENATILGEYLSRFRGELVGTDAWINFAVDHSLGLCAATTGQLDEAIELLAAGHAMYERLGLRARAVVGGLDLGRALLQRGGTGDRDAGEAHIRTTVGLAEQLGMTPKAREAAALL